LFSEMESGDKKELPIILKADVNGSIEAILGMLDQIEHDMVTLRVLHTGVGAVNESDVALADASDGIIIGFNVVPDRNARGLAEERNVEIRLYRIVYRLLEDIKQALEGLLAPEEKEVVLGHADVRQVFRVSRMGNIAGCFVSDGVMRRNARVRLIRNGVVIHEGRMQSMRHLQDDASEMREGFECGIKIDGFDDIKEGDVIECFTIEKIARKIE